MSVNSAPFAPRSKKSGCRRCRLGVATVDLPALWDADGEPTLVVIVTFSARSMSAASCPSPRRAGCACEGRGGANRASQVARPRSHDQSLCFLGHVLPSGDGLFRAAGATPPWMRSGRPSACSACVGVMVLGARCCQFLLSTAARAENRRSSPERPAVLCGGRGGVEPPTFRCSVAGPASRTLLGVLKWPAFPVRRSPESYAVQGTC